MKQNRPKVKKINRDLILVEGISCINANGEITESYDQLYIPTTVPKKIAPSGRKSTQADNATFYTAIDKLKKHGQFLPSLQLTIGVLKALADHKDENSLYQKVLDQYRGNRSIYGSHIVNTIVNDRGEIVHYPTRDDIEQTWEAHGSKESRDYSWEQRERASFDQHRATIKSRIDVLKPFENHGQDFVKRMNEPEIAAYMINLTGTKKVAETLELIAKAAGTNPAPTYFYDATGRQSTIINIDELAKRFYAIAFGRTFYNQGDVGIGSGGGFDGSTSYRGFSTEKPNL